MHPFDELKRLVAARAKATGGNWFWGDGWNASTEGKKYADMQLKTNSSIIIPIRIDHYEPIWDADEECSEPSKDDRNFIALAGSIDLPAILAACERDRELTTPRPISEAPKDGTWVMGFDGRKWNIIQWDDRDSAWFDSASYDSFPTHFLPMPPSVE